MLSISRGNFKNFQFSLMVQGVGSGFFCGSSEEGFSGAAGLLSAGVSGVSRLGAGSGVPAGTRVGAGVSPSTGAGGVGGAGGICRPGC